MPVCVIARKTRYFQSQHDAGVTIGDLGDKVLKAISPLGAGTGHTEIVIDDVNTFDRPSERNGTIAQRILPFRTLGILEYLAK
ncbi:hypothetical protein A9O66_27890 [Paraburkholderia caribensis]|uniref:Uncharacterized protein n=1 Tax=Paraburkholderia caribensis TaxID=75105 RepID=A0A9Q6S777_9BURK|nr:hypothetical protein A9O66_27890 [Paraburkholderia caribensis]